KQLDSQIIQMRLPDGIGKYSISPKEQDNKNKNCEDSLKTHGKIVNAKYSRVPMGIENHQPVERSEGKGYAKEKESRSAGAAQERLKSPFAGIIHLNRFAVHLIAQ